MKLAEVLETMQNDMLEKAKAFLASHINDAHDYNEFKAIVSAGLYPCYVVHTRAREQIKEDTTVTSRLRHLVTRSRFPTYAYAVESRRIESSYTGVGKRIKFAPKFPYADIYKASA